MPMISEWLLLHLFDEEIPDPHRARACLNDKFEES